MNGEWSLAAAQAALELVEAPPHALLAVVTAAARRVDPGAECHLLLVDYRCQELREVVDRHPTRERRVIPLDGSDAGRCFVSQRAQRLADDADGVAVPVSVRGDRLGVLLVRCPGVLAAAAASSRLDDLVEGLTQLADLLGNAVLAAETVTDIYRVARRERSLTLAAELQWDRLPGRSLHVGYASVAAQLEPAYTVVGDAYDWVADDVGLSAAIVDGSGYGIHAAANTSFTVAALRNGRREGADLAGMARLADQALYARFEGELFASSVLVDLAVAADTLRFVVAGTGTLLVTDRRSVRPVEVERHPPLGAEEDYPYHAQTLAVRPGDRIVLASDGLTTAQIGDETFGDRMERLVSRYRLLDASLLVRGVINDLREFHAGRPQLDDAVVMCVDVPA